MIRRILHSLKQVPVPHSNYNMPKQLEKCRDIITFDGIYKSVYEHRELLKEKDAILFVMGDYIGKNNQFDIDQNPNEKLVFEEYCTMNELLDLRDNYGCRLCWHTWSHRDLTTLPDDEIVKELTLPSDDFEKVIAYPYGRFNDRVIGIAQDLGYKDGYSVFQGDNTLFQRNRWYL